MNLRISPDGDRTGAVSDAFGNQWYIATPARGVDSPEAAAKARVQYWNGYRTAEAGPSHSIAE